MAPQQSKKRKSPSPTTMTLSTKFGSPARTPRRSPIRKRPRGITVAQKQALIDNLQLEITERARKLRAQYAEQAHSLRSRLEMRLSRVPKALRDTTMAELLRKYVEAEAQKDTIGHKQSSRPSRPALISKMSSVDGAPGIDDEIQRAHSRGTKRSSDDLQSIEDSEENAQPAIVNPKKRVKTTTKAAASTGATARAKISSNQVLSPKSMNSRTLPKSPVRPALSPAKSFLARSVSPFKQTTLVTATTTATTGPVATLVEKAKTKRATTVKKITAAASTVGAGRTKRPNTTAAAKADNKDRDTSSGSSTTTSRTLPATTKSKAAAPAKRTAATSIATKKAASTAETSMPARRNLRKRP